MPAFTHINSKGHISMVDVSRKPPTPREAVAEGDIKMSPAVIRKIKSHSISKGNVLETARLAAIMAAKKTDQLIPLCHPLVLDGIDIDFKLFRDRIRVQAAVKTTGKTGVEMEALTAAAVAGLTVYDMCKAVDRSMVVGPFFLKRKSGGRSGVYERPALKSS